MIKFIDRGTHDDLVIFGLPHAEVILHCVDVFGMCLDALLFLVVERASARPHQQYGLCSQAVWLKIALVTALCNRVVFKYDSRNTMILSIYRFPDNYLLGAF